MDKYKKLASNAIIFTIGSFSSKILSVLLLRLYTSCMSTDLFSTTSLIQTVVNLLEPLASLSMAEAIIRYGVEKSVKKSNLYSSAFAVALLGIIASMCLFPLIALYPDFRPYISYMMIFLFTSAFRWINQQQAKVKNYSKLFAIDGILSVLTLVLFMFIFLVGFKMTVKGYLLSLILSDLCSIFFLFYFADIYNDLSPRFVDRNLIRKMITYSLPIIPTKLLWWVVGSSDGFMVAGLVGKNENGVYQAAYKIPNLISTISSMFFYAWQMSAIAEYNSNERKKFYTKVFDAYIAIMFVGSAGVMFLLKGLTKLLVDPKYGNAYLLSPFLIISGIFLSFSMFLSSIYNATNNNKKSLKSSAWAAVINIVLNVLMIPLFDAQGAAFATMIAYFVCFIIRIVETQQIARYSVSWRRIGTDMVILLFMAIVILAKLPVMYLWLFVGLIAMIAVNYGPLEITVRKVLKRY